MLSKYTIFFVFLLSTHLNVQSQNTANKHRLRTVVIDAGHGGKDPGAIGKISKEKDITLAVALELGKKIHEELKDVKVIFTRNDDQFIELFERADIANRNKADIFISIHINSSKSKEAHGAEAWVLGLHKSDENLEVAKRENSVIQLEGNIEKNYGFDPNSPAGNIMMTMQQGAFLNHSIQFAKKVESEFAAKMNRKNRGVHQAGFAVLYKTVMPSCLIELGFISNREEEKYLNSDEGKEEITASILAAFKNFKSEYEGLPMNRRDHRDEKLDRNEGELKVIRETTTPVNTPKSTQTLVVEPRPLTTESNKQIKEKTTSPPKENLRIEKSNDETKTKKLEPITDENLADVQWNNNYVKVEEKQEKQKLEIIQEQQKSNIKSNQRIYRVQILARPEAVESTHPVFGMYNDVEELKEDKVYRYVCGKFENLDDALIRKIELKKRGYPDAFIAVYEGTKRIGMKF